jgi:hypothetical protein
VASPSPARPSAEITAPSGGETFALGEHVVTSFSCAEGAGGPGITSCVDGEGGSGTAGTLDTSVPGAHTYTVTATSADGQVASVQIAYTVAEPSNHFVVSGVRVLRSGAVQVTVTVPDAGTIQAIATHDGPRRGFAAAAQPTALAPGWHRFAVLAPIAVHVAGGGRVTLTLRRSARGRTARFVLGRLHLRLTVAFTPVMGATARHVRTVAVPARA